MMEIFEMYIMCVIFLMQSSVLLNLWGKEYEGKCSFVIVIVRLSKLGMMGYGYVL